MNLLTARFNPHFVLLLVLLPTLLILSRRRNEEKEKKKNNKREEHETWKLPPGPTKLPLIGNLHQLGKLPHVTFQHLSNHHGPLMSLQLGHVFTVVVSSADMVREICRNHDLVFSSRPVMYAVKKYSYGCSDMAFSPYGEYWRQVRKICILELLSLKRVQSFREVREEEVNLAIDLIDRRSRSSPLQPVNLSEMMLSLINDVVCRTVFGKKYGGVGEGECGKSRFDEILKEAQDLLGGFSIGDLFPSLEWVNSITGLRGRLERNFLQLDRFYDEVIQDHLDRDHDQHQSDHEDFVDVLLRVRKDPTLGIALTMDQIKGILTDMFIAGTDTSSATLVWIMTELAKNPTKMKRAQEEVRRVMGKKRRVEESDVHQLEYLKLVVKEGLRLHPPTPLLVPRETTDECRVGGYLIPAKTRVFINAKAISTDPKYWRNAQEFWPERFLDNPIDFKGQDFEFIPFGVGRRGCPAMNFAMSMTELALANLLHCFDWDLPQGMRKEDLDMEEAFGITMHKKMPLCLLATPHPRHASDF